MNENTKNLILTIDEQVTAAKQDLWRKAQKTGLARVADELHGVMLPSIRLNATPISENDLPVGCSKLGGTPDLPKGTPWPVCTSSWSLGDLPYGVPMALLAQIRMQDVASHNPSGRLPKSGMLYFFYEAREQSWGLFTLDRGKWQVIYHDGANLQRAVPPEDLPRESHFRACELSFSTEITLPDCDSKVIKRLGLSEKEELAYLDLGPEGVVGHRLLGHAEQVQNDVMVDCQLAMHDFWRKFPTSMSQIPMLEAEADNWELLLQLDSDPDADMMWGDVGRIYFCIHKHDLQNRDFGNVWMLLQCH